MSNSIPINKHIELLNQWKEYMINNIVDENIKEKSKKTIKYIFTEMNKYLNIPDTKNILKSIWPEDNIDDAIVTRSLDEKYKYLWNVDSDNSIYAHFIKSIENGTPITKLPILIGAIDSSQLLSKKPRTREMVQPTGKPPTKLAYAESVGTPEVDINQRIRDIIPAQDYEINANEYTIETPAYVIQSGEDPNKGVNVANDYIKVAKNISKIGDYSKLPGVTKALGFIDSAAVKFNEDIVSRGSKINKANRITISGGGKRKRNKKIGTRKKQYKRK